MAKVELKKPVVEEISSKIQGAQSVVLATYSGITVEQDTALRKELREAGVEYKVYKNTMMNFAFKGTVKSSANTWMDRTHLQSPKMTQLLRQESLQNMQKM